MSKLILEQETHRIPGACFEVLGRAGSLSVFSVSSVVVAAFEVIGLRLRLASLLIQLDTLQPKISVRHRAMISLQ